MVWICVWLWQPWKAPLPERALPDRREASSIPGNSVPEFKCGRRQNSQALSLSADHHSTRGVVGAAVSAAGSLWSYYGYK
jgi:hypothetical protein